MSSFPERLIGFTLPPGLSSPHRDTEDGTGSGPDGRVEGTDRVADGAAWGGHIPPVDGKHGGSS